MKNNNQKDNSGLTIKSIVVSITLALFLLTSSSFIALKMGALPWPIIFSVITSGAILTLLNKGKVNLNEINIAQSGATIGGLVSAGVVFTLPGILYLNKFKDQSIQWPNLILLSLVTGAAGVLGVLLSIPLKKIFIDKENLPYPSGTAGAELLKLGKVGGNLIFKIIIVGAIAGIFALYRDIKFPAGFSLISISSIGLFITLYPMPLASGMGFILGSKVSMSWIIGAVLGWIVIVPLLVNNDNSYLVASSYMKDLGMGIVMGSGIGFLAIYIVPRIKEILLPIIASKDWYIKLLPLFSIISIFLLFIIGVPIVAAIVTILGIFLMVIVAARMTGETDINPLEQFGIFVGLVVTSIYGLFSVHIKTEIVFIIVMFVSVACAVAGDIGHDFKSAKIIGTNFKNIIKIDLITALIAGLAAPFILEVIKNGFSEDLFSATMPAPQSQLVAGSIFGFQHPALFIGGFIGAFVFELINLILPKKYKNLLLAMPLGIGLFLGTTLAIPLSIGMIIRVIVDRKFKNFYYTGILVAAAIMGGEGIAGFGSASLMSIGIKNTTSSVILILLSSIIFLASLGCIYFQKSDRV